MKQQIAVFDYAQHILQALKTGVLLTVKAGETVNTMTIGWGTLGIEWESLFYRLRTGEPVHQGASGPKSGIYRQHPLGEAGSIHPQLLRLPLRAGHG